MALFGRRANPRIKRESEHMLILVSETMPEAKFNAIHGTVTREGKLLAVVPNVDCVLVRAAPTDSKIYELAIKLLVTGSNDPIVLSRTADAQASLNAANEIAAHIGRKLCASS